MEHVKSYLQSVKAFTFFFIIFTVLPSSFIFAEVTSDISHDVSLMNGLVSYWPLDEVSGTREDVKGNNNLIDNNTVSSATSLQGMAADLERGNNRYGYIPDPAEYLSITDSAQSGLDVTDSLSISAWIKVENAPPSQNDSYTIASKGSEVDGQWSWAFRYGDWDNIMPGERHLDFIWKDNSGSWGANSWDTHKMVTINNLESGTFHFVAVTANVATQELKFYVDGVQVGATQQGPSDFFNSSAPFLIGGYDNGYPTTIFDGLMDEVGLWNRALTVEEVAKLYNNGEGIPYTRTPIVPPTSVSSDASLSTGLVSYWPLDEVSGTREDAKGGNDLTDNNMVPSTIGMQGNSASFTPENNTFLSISDDVQSGLEPANISLAVWMKSNLGSADFIDEVLISKGASPGDYRLSLENGRALFFYVNGIPVASSYTLYADAIVTPYINNLDDGNWHHVIATYDGNVSKIYVDGSISAYRTIGAQVVGNTVSLTVGKLINGDGNDYGYFDGLIDEVGLWNRALTAEEVTKLYNDGKGLPYEVIEVSPEDCSDLTLKECIAKLETMINSTDLPRIAKKWLHIRIGLVEKLLEKKGKGKERAAEAILKSILRTFERKAMTKYLSDTEISELTTLVQDILDQVKK